MEAGAVLLAPGREPARVRTGGGADLDDDVRLARVEQRMDHRCPEAVHPYAAAFAAFRQRTPVQSIVSIGSATPRSERKSSTAARHGSSTP